MVLAGKLSARKVIDGIHPESVPDPERAIKGVKCGRSA
jgi:hypothetical protein